MSGILCGELCRPFVASTILVAARVQPRVLVTGGLLARRLLTPLVRTFCTFQRSTHFPSLLATGFHSCVWCALPVRYGKACTVRRFLSLFVAQFHSRVRCAFHVRYGQACVFRCCSARNSTRASGTHFPYVAVRPALFAAVRGTILLVRPVCTCCQYVCSIIDVSIH